MAGRPPLPKSASQGAQAAQGDPLTGRALRARGGPLAERAARAGRPNGRSGPMDGNIAWAGRRGREHRLGGKAWAGRSLGWERLVVRGGDDRCPSVPGRRSGSA